MPRKQLRRTTLLASLSFLLVTQAYGADYAVSLAQETSLPTACEQLAHLKVDWPDARVLSHQGMFHVVTGQFLGVRSAVSTRNIIRNTLYPLSKILPLSSQVMDCADKQVIIEKSQQQGAIALEQVPEIETAESSTLMVVPEARATTLEAIETPEFVAEIEVEVPSITEANESAAVDHTETSGTATDASIEVDNMKADMSVAETVSAAKQEPDVVVEIETVKEVAAEPSVSLETQPNTTQPYINIAESVQHKILLHRVNLPLIEASESTQRPILRQKISVQQQGQWYTPFVKDALNQLRIYAYREEWQEAFFLARQLGTIPEEQLSLEDIEVLGWIHAHQQQWERARYYFSLVLLQKEVSHVHYGLAFSALSLGQTAQARQLSRLLPNGDQKNQINQWLAVVLLYQ